jgi:hypothetical protein
LPSIVQASADQAFGEVVGMCRLREGILRSMILDWPARIL